MEVMNKYLVSASADNDSINIMNPPIGFMDKSDALLLAAWLVALTDPGQEEFQAVMREVLGT